MIKAVAQEITKYFRLHKRSEMFEVRPTDNPKEIAIIISKEDYERYLHQSAKGVCYICGETHRPYTKGKMIETGTGKAYHERCKEDGR